MLTPDKIRSQIAIIREASNNWLIDTCLIRYPMEATIVDGIPTETWSAYIEVPCRLIIRFGNDREGSSIDRVYEGRYRLQLPHDTYIDEGDQVNFNDRLFTVDFVPPDKENSGAFVIGIKEVTYA